MSAAMRSTALRAGGACVRCRKGKTKCFYETGDPPCRNCEKGNHACYLPSDRGEPPAPSPARTGVTRPPPVERPPPPVPGRHPPATVDKLTPDMYVECERVVNKTFPANIAFHKPSFIQQLKAGSLEPVLVYALLTVAARSSPSLIRRFSGPSGSASPADNFASKALALISQNLDTPGLADVQALCLLVIHEWGNRNAVRAYVYLGQAARMMQMHRILGTPTPSSDSEKFHHDESIRRTMWLIYVLDCLLTSTPGRRAALDRADYMDLSLPCSDMYFIFGNSVYVPTIENQRPPNMPTDQHLGEIGEFGFIVLGTEIWRDVVHFLTALRDKPFEQNRCDEFLERIDKVRASLPMQYVDKPQQINLHITMGSGFTFAMVHALMHCSSIFLQRRKMLDHIVPPVERDDQGNPTQAPPSEAWMASYETYRVSAQCHESVQNLFHSCHTVISLLNALEAQADKDTILCFPIYMLFAAFSASATIAYLSLKGLTPTNSIETAGTIVSDGHRFMAQANETWPLVSSWWRHLTVMDRVLTREGKKDGTASSSSHTGEVGSLYVPPQNRALSVKDETASNAETNPDAMDYEQGRPGSGHGRAHSEGAREDSEPPVQLPRRPGVTTISGGSGGVSTPATASPPAQAQDTSKMDLEPQARVPLPTGTNGHSAIPSAGIVVPSAAPPAQDMSAAELCAAFEKQLLELDDLAAFMGGGV